ncbi:MAG TPA: RidA family protein, partial [Candidatus Solibacter sp.]|nr:RidA family protein [Candidatus Solibacter sp.]
SGTIPGSGRTLNPMIERLNLPGAPAPRGPYSPAVRAGDFIYVSGQVPSVAGDIAHETRQVLANIQKLLAGCGATMADVVKCGVFLVDAGDFAAMNEVYATFFGENKPARSTVVAGFMIPNIRIEIDAVAYKPR